ncbi:hypothetical protein E2C01_029305 [Portunus trituberculatus]|uniref:Uncharacterized protein n=1 Tax=Portunus trituberculatus TaxID=210409 RepID=A0A5B7ERG9_PORTR|nr:hypothetical protein [Portunus trituberculatus]
MASRFPFYGLKEQEGEEEKEEEEEEEEFVRLNYSRWRKRRIRSLALYEVTLQGKTCILALPVLFAFPPVRDVER